MPDELALVPNNGWDQRLLVCRYGSLVDVFLIVTQRYAVLVDTLVNRKSAAGLLDIARPHLAGGRSLLVVNTHSHYDHAWGNEFFAGPRAAYPAPIIGTQRCAERLLSDEAEADLRRRQEQEPATYHDLELVAPTIRFDDRLTIDGGDLTLELFLTPGHAPDHIAIYIPQIRTLLAGDAAEAPFPFAGSAEELPVLRASLARMAALEPADALYCHAPAFAGPELLHENLAYFDRLEACCRAALDRGVPAAPPDDADIEALVEFPFGEAGPAGMEVTQPEFYRPGHLAHIRMMLAWLHASMA